MIKTIITCDCCEKEIDDKSFDLEHYLHVDPTFNRMNGHAKMINGDLHTISGRTVKKQFCLPCYNDLFDDFFKLIKEKQSKTVKS